MNHAERVCSVLGIPVVHGGEPEWYDGEAAAWTGQYLLMWPGMDENDLYHEIGHYVVATPRQRAHAGFGLGAAPHLPAKYAGELMVSPSQREDLEELSSCVGILIHGGHSQEGACNHAWFHDWHWRVDEPTWENYRRFFAGQISFAPQRVCRDLRRLVAAGLMDL